MLTMPGCMHGQSWLVPRTLANFFPTTWIHRLFPDYWKLTQEKNSQGGNESSAADNTLF